MLTMGPASCIAWLMVLDTMHMLKKEILSIDACSFDGGAGLPLIEFTAYGKTAASMKCLKCKANISKGYLNDGVNFDLHGTTSHTGASSHSLNFD